jgi:hypothetical protein
MRCSPAHAFKEVGRVVITRPVTSTTPKRESKRVEPRITSDRLLRVLAANLARAGDREPELIARLKAAAERLQAARRIAP